MERLFGIGCFQTLEIAAQRCLATDWANSVNIASGNNKVSQVA
jgi:hypothetical protein